MGRLWKLKHCLKKDIDIKIIVGYHTTEILYVTNTKEKIASFINSSVFYKFSCPGCSE